MARVSKKASVRPKRVTPSVKAQAAFAADQAAAGQVSHRLHVHNISAKTVNWTVSGGGNRAKGISPAGGESRVTVSHAKRYKITVWVKPDKKVATAVGPGGHVIFNGSKAYVTHPH